MKNQLFVLFFICSFGGFSQEASGPIIDVHLHAYEFIIPNMKASWAGEPYAQKLVGSPNAREHMRSVLAEIQKNNIKMAVVSSPSVNALAQWKQAEPGLFLTGLQNGDTGIPGMNPDSLKLLKNEGVLDMLGEMGLQYHGLEPDEPRMQPYYAVAEANRIPVCLHTGLGPPGAPHSFAPEFRTTLGKPSLFEPVLVRHPDLKAFLAHAGWPYIEETIAMMYIYPELYADIGVLSWALPKAAFYRTLEQLVDAGFGKRIMFGSDQMMWPEAISIAVETLREVPFLSDEEKRDIFYNNAAEFFELSEETIAEHHK